MAKQRSFNLFIYGTLTNPWVFRAVIGQPLVIEGERVTADEPTPVVARDAVLTGYRKLSPDNTYLYAVPHRQGRIQGYIVGPLPAEAMRSLREYEGQNYSRRTVSVQTAVGPEKAVVFIANPEKMDHSFGARFKDRLKQEILLDAKIDAALVETEREQLHTTRPDSRRAVAELHGLTIRDLIRHHFEAGGISDYAIRHSLKDEPLRDFSRIAADPAARAVAPNYLSMVIRQVIFNQFEDTIRRELRYELDHMNLGEAYYDRTVTSLMALRMINRSEHAMDILVKECLEEVDFGSGHLVDFVRWSVLAADAIFDMQLARQHLAFIRNHMGRGYVPLGAELEFSNIGHRVITGEAPRDRKYDGFLYFNDFALDVLTWKLGGHVDDHREKAADHPRRGFFETALGNVSIEANLSKPLTDDPWLLNQIIHETRRFFPIKPHSLHISLQLRRQQKPVRDRKLPLEVLLSLFALVGDPQEDTDGHVSISRLTQSEIIGEGMPKRKDADATPHMLFSEILRKRSSSGDDYDGVALPDSGGRYIQQFKFLRLGPTLNYEPIALALKGIQISLRPGTFLTTEQYRSSRKHRRVFDDLMAWARNPSPLGSDVVGVFQQVVHDGLMVERRGKCAHSEAYIAWAVARLGAMIDDFNRRLTRTSSKITTAGPDS